MTRHLRRSGLVLVAATILSLTNGSQALAQTTGSARPAALSVRFLGTFAVERFAADTTFGAIFGQPFGTLFGGGARVEHGRLFVEVTTSRFRRTGERAFAADGEGFGLDIPLTVSVTSIEVAAGRRLRQFRGSITPYIGTGLGTYHYKETSPATEPGEDVDARHLGWLLIAGAEFRVHRWIALAGDVHYTYVPGILGDAGLSQAVDEPNLGGVAARFKVIFGR